MIDNTEKLTKLFEIWSGELPVSVEKLPGSGSYRTYYRIRGTNAAVIGAHNEDVSENKAFVTFTNHFHSLGLPVPEILADDPVNRIYLTTDLGDMTLYQLLSNQRSVEDSAHKMHGGSAYQFPGNSVYQLPGDSALQSPGNTDVKESVQISETILNDGAFPETIVDLYKKALTWLPLFQVKAGKNLDYSDCYPRAAFDRQSMMWDLNYFKYYFLKLAKVPFDEQSLEDDFSRLCDLLLEADANFFLFRDFQSRNIMVVNEQPWFIDYQGGRKGPLQYDLASLLYDGKADLPPALREYLFGFYLGRLEEIHPVNRAKFLESYHAFVLIRILQALGAYGFRGYYENKVHFLQSIPFALRNLEYLRTNGKIGFGLSALMDVIDRMVETPRLYQQHFVNASNAGNAENEGYSVSAENINNAGNENNAENAGNENNTENAGIGDIENSAALNNPPAPAFGKPEMTITIYSFSFKKSIPTDDSGNGGGFVFDCRALPNPGRYDEFKQLSGNDQPVIDFLKKEYAVDKFLLHTFSLVDQSVKMYIDRGFENLMVSYGCTGGRHRSVYCAEKLSKYLKIKYKINIKLIHSENF